MHLTANHVGMEERLPLLVKCSYGDAERERTIKKQVTASIGHVEENSD